jgi:general secretion pathway protein B
MSYILDALKKAERERGITQAPTVMTVHEPRSLPQNGRWIALGALMVLAGAAIWFFLYSRNTNITAPTPSPSGNGQPQGANVSASRSIQDAVPTNTAEPQYPAQGLPSFPKAGPSNDSRAAIPAMGRAISRSSPPSQTESLINSPDAAESDRHMNPPAQAGADSRQRGRESLSTSSAAKTPSQTSPDAGGPTATGATLAASVNKAKPAPLKEALAKMSMTILYYSENKAERVVFINNRRYAEGDYVDGIYFLESITLDGAVLSYEGERAVLRPGTK